MSETKVLHLFGGKGGAGKTTLSTAFALNLLETNGKEKILLTSFDSNGGLSDLLKKKLSGKPTKLLPGKGTGGLFASELEHAALAEPLAAKVKAAFTEKVLKSQLLADDDVKKLLEAYASNLGEVAALFHLVELIETKQFDRVVVDGLGASHTVRALDHAVLLRKLISLQRGEKPPRAGSKTPPPRGDGQLEVLAQRCESVTAFIKDEARFGFHLCALAEPVPEAQVRWLFTQLRERNIPIARIIADQIEDGKDSREVANRRGLQAPHVRKFQSLGVPVELLQRRIVGPRGLDEVKKFGKDWASGKETKALAFSAAEGPPALVRAPGMPPIAAPPLPPTRFLFFVGGGGVGKSSCAAAAAVTLTEKEGPVLLLSADPAHSLSDVLLSRLTDTETQVKGTKGLYAREIDFATWYGNLRKKFKERAEAAFGPEQKGQEFALDRELVRNLWELAPTGMDELAAMSTVTDALVQERFKRIVIDPAPTGNTMRLLELPAVAKQWLTTVLAIFTKYRAKGLGPMADELAAILKHVQRFEAAILNPNECRFVVVTRGEELAMPPVERLVEYLKAKKLPVERVLVNRVLPKTTCPVTEERRNNELAVAKAFEKKIGLQVTVAPALGRHPAGLRELKAFRTSWYALSVPAKIKAA
ncbi:MAG: TRC40/GET3/ArsA family transport-energizing ATPase [Myxococcaceae bacterium]|nr:TRC40/GET3/ArsA family transport-energizing ATPase [Myxococcaceae bacterium]